MPSPSQPGVVDAWEQNQRLLESEGWIFYSVERYVPTRLRGFTSALSGTTSKRNRPLFLWLRPRNLQLLTGTWDGTLSFAAVSALNPWVPGAVMPPDESDWAQGVSAHYLSDWSLNPIAEQEMAAAETSPTMTITRAYGDCSDPAIAEAAIRDLYQRIR